MSEDICHEIRIKFPCPDNIDNTRSFQNSFAFFLYFIPLRLNMKKCIIYDDRIKHSIRKRHICGVHYLKSYTFLFG